MPFSSRLELLEKKSLRRNGNAHKIEDNLTNVIFKFLISPFFIIIIFPLNANYNDSFILPMHSLLQLSFLSQIGNLNVRLSPMNQARSALHLSISLCRFWLNWKLSDRNPKSQNKSMKKQRDRGGGEKPKWEKRWRAKIFSHYSLASKIIKKKTVS